METLKLKFKLHALEFEVEGAQEAATKEFKNFHDNILTPLLTKVSIISSNQTLPAPTSQSTKETLFLNQGNPTAASELTDEFPNINDIGNNIDISEADWLAIYAFYDSEFGAKPFNKNVVREKYFLQRKTKSRAKNYMREWSKLLSSISTVNENEFKLKQNKIEEIKRIIRDDREGVIKKTSVKANKKYSKSSKSHTNKTPAKSIEVVDFDVFGNNQKISLEKLFEDKKPDSTNDRILLIAYYITRINKHETFSEGNIDYAYKALQLKDRPNYLRQTIINIKNSKVWFKDHQNKGWTLERLGEIYVDKMPKNVQ